MYAHTNKYQMIIKIENQITRLVPKVCELFEFAVSLHKYCLKCEQLSIQILRLDKKNSWNQWITHTVFLHLFIEEKDAECHICVKNTLISRIFSLRRKLIRSFNQWGDNQVGGWDVLPYLKNTIVSIPYPSSIFTTKRYGSMAQTNENSEALQKTGCWCSPGWKYHC